MRKILAVSGGIDSMVLLDLYRDDPEARVAHFDHGIRECSRLDCDFVSRAAARYGKAFFSKTANLGADCSEETARKQRYAFLKELCREQGAILVTAHHADDLVESITINLLRGTGWRGLTPFSDEDIFRPLLRWTKNDIYRYATEHQISFRADSTNTEDKYLRNRVRDALRGHDSEKNQLLKLYIAQLQNRREIEQIESQIIGKSQLSRDLLNLDVAAELLREFLAQNHIRQTRPQILRALDAARTLSPGKSYSLNKDFYLKIGRYYLSIAPR